MSTLCIDEVYPKSIENPLIVNFQNGYPTDEFVSKSCFLYEDKNAKFKSIAVDVCNLLYAGDEEKEDLGKTLILARNKITGKVRLIEAGNVEVKPVIKHNLDSVLDTSRLELSRKFGSKKQKKVMEQREKLKVNTETVVNQMHNVTINIAEDQVDLSSYTKTDSEDFYIPPINREATDVSDVYDLYKILTKEQYEKINSEIGNKDITSDMVEWIRNIVINKSLSTEYKVLALYASCLIKLYGTMMKEIIKKAFCACPHSPTLNEVILNNFTSYVNSKRNRSLQLKDKSLCHAIVFLLIINDFKYSAEDLGKHVNMALRTLTTKVRVLGASVVTSGSKKIVQLKLPLSTSMFVRRKSAKF
ncbi:uncharacterized protein LOC128681962 [Plodia interpunctella]|uniref:uncharacterized protein LOC128681962 n=1 Tax=Plodia interpunctella TaxID=58824 RepID=UPI002367CBCD|nr:uncharacterized protein LOC128681962 [Plodia interpunctella]